MKTGMMLRVIRQSDGLSQTKAARTLDVSRAYLSQVESDRKQPSLTLLREFSEKFQIPLILLLTAEANASGTTAQTPEEQAILSQLHHLFSRIMADRAARRVGLSAESQPTETYEDVEATGHQG